MKLSKNIIGLLFLLPLMNGCSDFLDVKDESAISKEIWDNEQSATLYVNNIYKECLPPFGGDYVFGSARPTDCSDEVGGDLNKLLEGTLGFEQVGAYSASAYSAIRYINVAFNELKNSKMTEAEHNRVAGQLYFFRAWQHWKMVLMHGGVPYMTEVVGYDSEDDLKNAKRNKTSDCIKYLEDDLNHAIDMLPATWGASEWGRVTRSTAAALLGRILLYYASPQFTPDQQSAEAKARWDAAYKANKRANEICIGDGYKLMDCKTAVTEQWPASVDINTIFLTNSDKNTEALFVHLYSAADGSYHDYENSIRPGAQTTDTQNRPSNLPSVRLAMAFPNADGTVYDKPANNVYFWKDRDSRFYSTIVYNGCYFPYKGITSYRQWTYKEGDPSGAATTTTGYYCRKMLNPATQTLSQTETMWIEIRYAEVLLNLAEAAVEIGDENTMYECLGKLRQRAGIPEGDYYYGLKVPSDMNKLELVMNERFIEQAFEGRRFYDLRRRNMFTEDLGTVTTKLNGEKKGAWGVSYQVNLGVDKDRFKEERDEMTMEEVSQNIRASKTSAGPMASPIAYKCIPTEEELRNVTTGNYNFFDLQDGILTRSPAVQQTMGWSYDAARGCFNPFE